MAKPVKVAGVCFLYQREHILLIRKQHATQFFLPGGKPHPHESIHAAAIRECAATLNITVDAAALRFLGRWTSPAANRHDRTVDATVYVHDGAEYLGGAEHLGGAGMLGEGGGASTLGAPKRPDFDIVWVPFRTAHEYVELAPLLATKVLPALRKHPYLGQVRP